MKTYNYSILRDFEPRITQTIIPLYVLASKDDRIIISLEECSIEEALNKSMRCSPLSDDHEYYSNIQNFLYSLDFNKIISGEESILDYFGTRILTSTAAGRKESDASKRKLIKSSSEEFHQAEAEKIQAGISKIDNIWIKKGDAWQIEYQGNDFILEDHVGVRYIAYLLQNPGTGILCTTLYNLINAPPIDAILDQYSRMSIDELERENLERLTVIGSPEDPSNLVKAISIFKAEYLQLGQALKRAKKSGNDNLARKLAAIREQIDDKLKEITNKYGLPRSELSDSEKARKRVSLRIQDVIDKIRGKKYHKTLSRHLQKFIKKGTYCIYEPIEDTKWEVDF